MNLKSIVNLLHPYDTYIHITSRSNENLYDSGYAAAFQNYSYKERLEREVISYKVDRKADTGVSFISIVIS